MAPKTISFGSGGLISYKASYEQLPFGISYATSPTVYGYQGIFFIPSVTDVVGWPVATPPAAYTPDKGQKAWDSVCLFMTGKLKSLGRQNEMVSISAPSKWQKNVSPYAYTVNPTGWGFADAGGWNVMAYHEVPIYTPYLSLLNKPVPASAVLSPSRGNTCSTMVAGSPLMIGAFMSSLWTRKSWDTRYAPDFAFVDFNEFADVLAIFVAKAQSAFAALPGSSRGGVDPAKIRCPLSLQEMTLLLRNEAMYVFGASQPGVQALMPRLPESGNDNEFVSYCAGSNTCSMDSADMYLPRAFVENLMSLQVLSNELRPDGTRDPHNPKHYIPVLGQYYADSLSSTSYNFEYEDDQGNVLTLPSFNTGPTYEVRNTKGAFVGVPEPVIDLVDGASSSEYLFINDTTKLEVLSGLWNEWIDLLKSVVCELTTVTANSGLRVLGAVTCVRHWGPPKATANARHEGKRDTRLAAPRLSYLTATDYANRQQFAITSVGPILTGTDIFLRKFVLPINKAVSGNQRALTSFSRVQSNLRHGYSLTSSATGDEGAPLSDIHANFATALIRGLATPKTAWDTALDQLDINGHAGFLSSLASALGGAVFGSEAGQAIGSITSAVGL